MAEYSEMRALLSLCFTMQFFLQRRKRYLLEGNYKNTSTAHVKSTKSEAGEAETAGQKSSKRALVQSRDFAPLYTQLQTFDRI